MVISMITMTDQNHNEVVQETYSIGSHAANAWANSDGGRLTYQMWHNYQVESTSQTPHWLRRGCPVSNQMML